MKRSLLLIAAAGFFYLSLSSYSLGPGITSPGYNCTGSYGSQNTCDGSNCHGGNSQDVVVDLTIRDMFGNTVSGSQYFPGATYQIKVSGFASNGSFSKYSYQFSASSAYGPTGGSFIPTSDLHTAVVGSAIIVEPNQPLNTYDANNSYADSFLWKAPTTTAWGQWTLYATVLEANDDGTRYGDKANNYQRTLSPVPLSVASISEQTIINVYPNPVKDQATLKFENAQPGDYQVVVYNTQGQILYQHGEHLNAADFQTAINTSSWASGNYYMEILNEGKRRVLPMIKQ